jgi:hypothetical protein
MELSKQLSGHVGIRWGTVIEGSELQPLLHNFLVSFFWRVGDENEEQK